MVMRPSPPTSIEPIVIGPQDGFRRQVAALLARRRIELGYSQIDFDAVSGLADGHMAKIEAGSRWPIDETLSTVLAALGVSIEVRLLPDPGRRLAEPLRSLRWPGARQEVTV